MQITLTIRLPPASFWLSLLLHAFILASCLLIITFQPAEKTRTPTLYTPPYVPSYMYTGRVAPPTPPAKSSSKPNNTPTPISKPIDNAGTMPFSEQVSQKSSTSSNNVSLASIMASTQTALKNNQRDALNSTKNSEPIYLIGDMDGVADPLVKLLGISLSANFKYPQMEGELGIKGRVLIGLTLHPEGFYSNIQVMQSSNNHDFDAAALYAVNQAPAIPGADRFISEPKHFVIGFIFR